MSESHRQLWAPWRMDYLRSLDAGVAAPAPATAPAAAPTPNECFLCLAAQAEARSDEARQRLVLLRDPRGVILLNRFPYTNGHLLVAPADHLGDLTDLTTAQRADLIELTALAEQLLRQAINPQGINIGINLGRCAGAGVPGHLHVHVVPRWSGDVNFMNTIANARVIPQALDDSYAWLAQTLAAMGNRC